MLVVLGTALVIALAIVSVVLLDRAPRRRTVYVQTSRGDRRVTR